MQTAGGEAPLYEGLSESGPAHNRRYEVKVIWQGKELGRGVGSSKKEAETNAARAALEGLKD